MEDVDMEDNKMVSVQYECETDISLELDCEALAKKVAQSVLELENCPYDSQVNLVLTDNSGIHEVNRQFRGIDAPTDVLSFPFLNISAGDVINKEDFPFDLDNDEIYLGDIAVCTEKAAEQAEEYGHSFKRELFYLILHGFLHLLGYDHMTEDDKKLMRLKEEEILTGMDIE